MKEKQPRKNVRREDELFKFRGCSTHCSSSQFGIMRCVWFGDTIGCKLNIPGHNEQNVPHTRVCCVRFVGLFRWLLAESLVVVFMRLLDEFIVCVFRWLLAEFIV